MRRLTTTDRDDRGGATVFIIVAITAVMIGVGFAIDVGQYVAAARSAQNTADATALAVATDCALTGAPNADYSPYRKPGQTISSPACGSGEATITAAKDVNGLFLQQSAGGVDRTATARWGTIAGANVLPIVIADCEWDRALLDGTSDITLTLDHPRPGGNCAPELAGGFSRLDGGTCSVPVSTGGLADGQPGGALQQDEGCYNPLPQVVLIPMYDTVHCEECMGQGPYLISGIAAFRLTGYVLNGNRAEGSLSAGCPGLGSGPPPMCIRGDFIEWTTSQGNTGPSTNFGVTQVYLYS
jgi:Flp pilus assembly protein TadG